MTVKVGNEVKFKARGMKIGVVTKLFQGKDTKRLQRMRVMEKAWGDGGHPSTAPMKAKILSGETVWTVPVSAVTEVLGIGDLDAAQRVVQRIKGSHVNAKINKQIANYDASEANNLHKLQNGDSIEVKFRDAGWQVRTYAGRVKSSGNVRYLQNGRKRTTPAKFVRIPE